MQDSSEDASDSEDQKATKKQNVSKEPFIRKGLMDDEHWLVGAGSEAEDIGGEKVSIIVLTQSLYGKLN